MTASPTAVIRPRRGVAVPRGLAEFDVLLRQHRPGIDRRLSDLLAHQRSNRSPVYVTDDALHAGGAGDPVLYTAHRDVLDPRQAGGTEWFADLVVYQPGELPGGELYRSTGHWNTPTQVEVFQTLTGRTLMITAWRTAAGRPMLRYQVCAPGALAVVPFGAWHLTLVLDGPAAMFNLYTDLPGTSPELTARNAAHHQQVKYGRGNPVEITAVRIGRGFSITGSARGLATWGRGEPTSEPPWLRGIVGADALPEFFTTADPHTLADLCEQASHHLPAANRSEHP